MNARDNCLNVNVASVGQVDEVSNIHSSEGDLALMFIEFLGIAPEGLDPIMRRQIDYMSHTPEKLGVGFEDSSKPMFNSCG